MKITTLASAVASIALMTAASSARADNLLVNGDFSQWNTGFQTGYQYVDPGYNALYPEGRYPIASDPHAVINTGSISPARPSD